MLAAFLAPVDLGDDYQIENQGLAGILAGLAFFGYIAFNAIADANDTGGIVSATARLIGIFFAVAIIIAITFTFPNSMKRPKLLMAALCILGVIMQFHGVRELMKPIAETWSMYGWLRFSNLCFMGGADRFRVLPGPPPALTDVDRPVPHGRDPDLDDVLLPGQSR